MIADKNKGRMRYLFQMGLFLGMAVVMFGTLSGCQSNKTVTKSGFLLDTFVSITLYGETDEALLEKPYQRIKELNDQLTAFESGSELQLIKDNAGIRPVVVSNDTFEIIKKSLDYSNLSNGKFDVTIGPLVDLWGIESPEVKEPPAEEQIVKTKELIDYQKLVLNETDQSVYLTESGMSVNLGAIAKGYIADEIMEMLKEEGVSHALINLGGNVLVMGGKTDVQSFGVGVEDPENPGEGYLGVISLETGAVVTSGNYQRYFTDSEGNRYHHILDPDTGYPADNGVIQVTVVTEKSIDADALSTTLFLLGVEDGLELIDEIENVEAVFITQDDQIFMSPGAGALFTFDSQNYGEIYTVVD